jgi:thiol-disulfide isomerase/thioredoxin
MTVTLIHNVDTFRELKGSDNYNLFMFSAQWCAPCKKVFPLFQELALSQPPLSTLGFYKVDIEDCDVGIAEIASVTALPTFILYKSGSAVKQVVGGDKDEITALVEYTTQQ